MKGGRVNVSFHLLRVACADDRAGHGRISKGPRDRNLTGRTLNPFADFSQTLNQREILRQPRLLKLDVATAPIAFRKICRSVARHRAGQQSGRHWRIDNHADSLRSTISKNLLLYLTVD